MAVVNKRFLVTHFGTPVFPMKLTEECTEGLPVSGLPAHHPPVLLETLGTASPASTEQSGRKGDGGIDLMAGIFLDAAVSAAPSHTLPASTLSNHPVFALPAKDFMDSKAAKPTLKSLSLWPQPALPCNWRKGRSRQEKTPASRRRQKLAAFPIGESQ